LAIAFRVLGLQRAVIGPDASCAEWVFSWFSSATPGKYRNAARSDSSHGHCNLLPTASPSAGADRPYMSTDFKGRFALITDASVTYQWHVSSVSVPCRCRPISAPDTCERFCLQYVGRYFCVGHRTDGTDTELTRHWYGTDRALIRNWHGTDTELTRHWYGTDTSLISVNQP
jgi:hypothetical protein